MKWKAVLAVLALASAASTLSLRRGWAATNAVTTKATAADYHHHREAKGDNKEIEQRRSRPPPPPPLPPPPRPTVSGMLNLSDPNAIPRSDRYERLMVQRHGKEIFVVRNYRRRRDDSNNSPPTATVPRNAPEVGGGGPQYLLVHVGKTGGISLRSKLFGKEKETKKDDGDDDDPAPPPRSALARGAVGVIHAARGVVPIRRPGGVVIDVVIDPDDVTAFLVPVRDPVDRFVSWFYHNLKDLRKYRNQKWRVKFFSCFPKGAVQVPELLFASLSSPPPPPPPSNGATGADPTASHSCLRLALKILHGQEPDANHMFRNMMWYTKATLLRSPDKPFYVFRTKHLWEDFGSVDAMVGGSGDDNTTNSKWDHGTIKHDSVRVPERLLPTFCCVLVEEYDAYRYLLLGAENAHRGVGGGVAGSWNITESCRMPSFEELVDSCPTHLLPVNYRIQDTGGGEN